MRFVAVQFDIAWQDKAANQQMIERMLQEMTPPLRRNDYVLLPELADTGFSMNLHEIVDEWSLNWAKGLARRLHVYVQHGFPRIDAAAESQGLPAGRNCAAVIDANGTILAEYQKIHPFSYGKESQFYSGGDHLTLVRCGDTVVCPMICYDLRFPELWRLGALAGAEVFTIGASWPAPRQHHWRAMLTARAIENQAYVVAVNRVGNDPNHHYAGGSIIVSPTGDIIVEAGDHPTVLQADLDLSALRQWRQEFPALRDVRPGLLGRVVIR